MSYSMSHHSVAISILRSIKSLRQYALQLILKSEWSDMAPSFENEKNKAAAQADKLLDDARKLKEQSKKNISTGSYNSSLGDAVESIKAASENISAASRFLISCKETILGFYQRVLAPIVSILYPPVSWIVQQYKKIWERFAFTTDAKTGHRVLSRHRSSLLIVITFLFLSSLIGIISFFCFFDH